MTAAETVPTTLDVDGLRRAEFPWTRRGGAYLNHASTGPLPRRTVRALTAFTEARAEPWRVTTEMQFGTLARSRELCAQLVGATPGEIALMINTTYGLNLAARALPLDPGDVVVTSDREFPSNIYPWMALERARGVSLRVVPCRDRVPDEARILAELDLPRVRALVLSWVSFESGYRADLARLGAACRERGIYFVVDGIQGLGAATLDVGACAIDVFACGAQKWLLGPWGTGFVYVRRELVRALDPPDVSWMATRNSDDFGRLIDYDCTWRDDARRFEMITLPYQDFAGMNASLELLVGLGGEQVARRIHHLATRIVEWAREQRDTRLVTPAEPARRAGIVAVVPSSPAAVSERLTRAGVIHALREGAIRLSPHCYNTDDEIDRALALMAS